jgi:hypothetical protein
MRFATESELVAKAIRHLPFRHWLRAPSSASVFQAREMKGLFGVPDFVAAVVPPNTGQRCSTPSVAFEMKLSDWRRGLIQAFRYRAFARVAYLVLDASRIGPAVANTERFERSNVGLVGIETDGRFTVYHVPQDEEPFCPDLAERFIQVIHANGTHATVSSRAAVGRFAAMPSVSTPSIHGAASTRPGVPCARQPAASRPTGRRIQAATDHRSVQGIARLASERSEVQGPRPL